MVQIRGLLPRGQLVLNVAAQSVQENALQSLLIPPALSREGPELDRKGGDTSGTLAEMQETLGGLPAPDRVVEDLSHLLGEGGVVGADSGTAFPYDRRPSESLPSQRPDQEGVPGFLRWVGLGLQLEYQGTLEQE